MALFFFDVDSSAESTRDDCGSDLPDLEAVQKEALGILSDIAYPLSLKTARQDITVDVRNEDGQYIYTVSMLLVARQLG